MFKANSSSSFEERQLPTALLRGHANRRLLLGAGCLALLLFGVVMAVLGTMFGLPAFRERLHINFAQQGQLLLLLYFGMLLADLTTGSFSDHLGRKWVLAISCGMVGAALAGLATAETFGRAALLIVLLGLGGGGLNVNGNALVSDVSGESRGAMLNLAGAFYGVGALLVPLFVAGSGARFATAYILGFAAAFALACGLFLAALSFPKPRQTQTFSLLSSLRTARYPGLWVLTLILALQAGNEAASGGWTSSYAGAAGHGPGAATLVLACYWAAMIAGRTLATLLDRRLGKADTILASAGLAALGCVLLLAAHTVLMLALGAAVIGFAYGPIFQTGLSIAGDRYPEATGSVFGLMLAAAVPGCMAWPWALGEIAQNYSIRYGMLIPLAGALGICVLAGAIRSSAGRRP